MAGVRDITHRYLYVYWQDGGGGVGMGIIMISPIDVNQAHRAVQGITYSE